MFTCADLGEVEVDDRTNSCVCVLEIDAVLFVEPTVEIGWDRIFLLF
jgi:hypothetical protein